MSTRKRIPGCLRCQERHVKCDRGKPTCSSCRNHKYSTVCEYAPKRLRFRQSRYTSALASTGTRREAHTVRTPSADSNNEPRTISGTSDKTHAASSTLSDYGNHHPSSIDGSRSARNFSSAHSSVVSPVPSAEGTSRYPSSPLPVADDPLTPKPPVPSYCLYPLGLSPVGLTPDASGYPINNSSVSGELSHPGARVDIAHVSPSTASYQTSLPPSRTLTDEIDCKVFAFYVENAGHWVCISSSSIFAAQTTNRLTDVVADRLTLVLQKGTFIHMYPSLLSGSHCCLQPVCHVHHT